MANTDNAQQAATPSLSVFQLDSGGVSTQGINLFRGNLSFPLNLISLPGLNNLNLSISLMYQSNVQNYIDQSNIEAQTDIVGLGWSLPFGKIVTDGQLAGVPSSRNYYLVDGGQTQKLIPIPISWAQGEVTLDKKLLQAGQLSTALIQVLSEKIKCSRTAQLQQGTTQNEWLLKDDDHEKIYRLNDNGKTVEISTAGLCFELENYRFWQITYYQEYEKWVIIKEDGTQYTYGGTGTSLRAGQEPNVLQWGIKWNNWVGNSIQEQNQQPYVTAWNLAKVENVFGNYHLYNYQVVEQAVGSGTLKYTKECHVAEVRNDLGWSCTYSYKPMVYNNCSLDAPKEYIDPCKDPTQKPDTTPNAFQSRYITVYLDKMTVFDPAGETPLCLQFDYYDLQNLSKKNEQNDIGLLAYGGTYKRYLKAITQYCADGEPKPGLVFYYNFSTDTTQNRGALTQILYPAGGIDVFSYEQIQIGGDQNQDLGGRNLTIANPFGGEGSKPRVWYGEDYVLCGWSDDNNQLKVNIFTWVGRWQQSLDDWLTFSGGIDLDKTQAIANQDCCLLSISSESSTATEVYLFNRQYLCNANWIIQSDGSSPKKYRYNTGTLQISAGKNFFLVNDQDNHIVDRYTWNWTGRDWDIATISNASTLCQASSVSNYRYYVTAYNNYYITLCYGRDSETSQFSIYYTDGLVDAEQQVNWYLGSTYTPNEEEKVTIPGFKAFSYFNYAPSDSFAAIAYVTGYTPDNKGGFKRFNYALKILSWDENFDHLQLAPIAKVNTSNFKNITTSILNAIGPVVVGNTLIGAGPNYFYYDGATWNAGNVGIKWNGGFSDLSRQYYWYAYATNAILKTENTDSGIYGQVNYMDVNTPGTGWHQKELENLSSPPPYRARQYYPTISADTYLTNNTKIYNRYTRQGWDSIDSKLLTELSDRIDTTTIINQSPYFIAYMTVDRANNPQDTKVLFLRNGDFIRDARGNPVIETMIQNGKAQKMTRLLDEKFHYRSSYSGLFPAIVQGFMTYPISDEVYEATEITLHHYSNQSMKKPITTFVVNRITTDTGYQQYAKCYRYEKADAAQDSTGTIIKFQKVTEYLGCSDPKKQRDGYIVSHFYNGLPPTSAMLQQFNVHLFAQNSYSILDGVLVAKEQYDAKNNVVSRNEYVWNVATQVSTDAAGKNLRNLYGGIPQTVSMTSMLDGVSTTTQTMYSIASGNPTTTESSYYGSTGEEITQQSILNYAYEYYDDMWQRNILNASAQTLTQTKAGTESAFTVQSANVQTYKNWTYADHNYWGTFEKYTATTADTPSFTWWDGSKPNAQWLRLNTITARDTLGNILESSDADNIKSTVIYDNEKKLALASFVNATVNENAISYDSFEAYQTSSWQCSNTSGQIITTDSFTGTSCFNMTATGSLSKMITLSDLSRSYVFACWIKTPKGANASQITVAFQATNSNTQKHITQTIDLTDGQWNYTQWVMNCTSIATNGTPIQLSINATINGTNQYVRIDDIFFMPLDCAFSASVYDYRKMRLTASIAPNGICERSFYDQYYSNIATIGAYENPLGFKTAFLTRQTNRGTTPFPADQPNCVINVGAQGNGFYDEFKQEALSHYTFINSAMSDWQVANNTLTLKSTSTAPLGAQVRRQNFQADNFAVYVLINADSHNVISLSNVISLGTGNAYVLWNQGKWQLGQLQEGSFTVIQEVSNIALQAEWVLVVLDSRLLFFANGILIFNHPFNDLGKSYLDLGMQQPGSFSQLIVAEDIQLSMDFRDGLGSTVQSIVMESNDSVLLSANIQDHLGRNAISLKPSRITTATVADPFRYNNAYVSNAGISGSIWSGAPIEGTINQYHPECGGYPFSRQVYESAPTQRVIQIGQAGIDFAITAANNLHITSIQYQNNQTDPGFLYPLPDGQYYKTVTQDPDGNIETSYIDVAQNHIGVIQSSTTSTASVKYSWVYNDNNQLIAAIPPNYYQANPTRAKPITIPPEATTTTYDFLGRKIAGNNLDTGSERYISAHSSLIRFVQDDTGKAKGYFHYNKYDKLGRIIENGRYDCEWDPKLLEDYACNKPNWPMSNTWSRRYTYDGDNTTPNMLGRIWKRSAYNEIPNDVVEISTYNRLGNVLSSSRVTQAYDATQEYVISYDYNCIGTLVSTTDNITGLTISRSYNTLGQLIKVTGSVGTTTTQIADYTYDQEARMENVSLFPTNNGALTERQYRYNAQWLEMIQDGNITENLQYTQDGYDQAGYYTGAIANQAVQYTNGDQITDQYCFAIDHLQRIATANNATESNNWAMDDNSNFITHTKNNIINTYTLKAGTNQLQSIVASDGSVNRTYQYTESGEVCTIKDAHGTTTLNYYDNNRLIHAISLPANKATAYQYSSDNQRSLKTTTLAGNIVAQRLYIHGAASLPTLEIDKANNIEQVKRYIHIPGATLIWHQEQFYVVSEDHLGSTRAIIDQANHIVGQYNYDIYGAPTVIKAPDFAFDYLYTFQEYEEELGLYNYKLRLYDPTIGRFLMADPGAQYFSPYVYVGNNPTICIDPTGAMSIGAILGIIGGVVVTAAAAAATAASFGAATPLLTSSLLLDSVIIGTALSAGTSSISYSATHQNDWNAKDWGINVGIEAAAGAASIGAGFGLGSLVGRATVAALSQGASTSARIAAATLGGATVGAASNVLGTLTANGISGNNLKDGLGDSAWQGAVAGGVLGAVGGALGTRIGNPNAPRGPTLRSDTRPVDELVRNTLNNHKVYAFTGESTARGVAVAMAETKGTTIVISGTHGDKLGMTYADTRLARSYKDSSFALQDLVNAPRNNIHVYDSGYFRNTNELDTLIKTGVLRTTSYKNVILGYCFSNTRFNRVAYGQTMWKPLVPK